MGITKEKFLEKIKNYVSDENISNEKEFWLENREDITKIIESNSLTWEDFLDVKNAMDIFRWKYLMNSRYMTIDKDYQDMCRVFITLLLQKKALWLKNFLRYFDPNSAYYKRIETLDLFRNLNNPSEDIENLLPIVWKNLYDSVQLEPESLSKATNIFKEYIERIFSITRLDKNSRVDFLVISDDNLDYFYEKTDLNEWLLNIIAQDDAVVSGKIEDDTIADGPTQVEMVKDGNVYEETIVKIENENREAMEQIKQKEWIIKALNEKFEELQKLYDSMKVENENRISNLSSQLDKLRDENVNMKINNLSKQESLLSKIEEYRAKSDELEKRYTETQSTLERLLSKNEGPTNEGSANDGPVNEELTNEEPTNEGPANDDENVPKEIVELRKFYNIVVVWWSERINKKFNRLMKNAEVAMDMYKDWWLEVRQFHLEWDFKKQKDKKLAKKVEDKLSWNIANFVIVLQSDHNTALASLIENPEYTTRITVLWEREENDWNPAYGQSLSIASFKYYLKRAIDKYERDIINSMW